MHKLLQASINTNSGINKFAKPESKTLVIPLHICIILEHKSCNILLDSCVSHKLTKLSAGI